MTERKGKTTQPGREKHKDRASYGQCYAPGKSVANANSSGVNAATKDPDSSSCQLQIYRGPKDHIDMDPM